MTKLQVFALGYVLGIATGPLAVFMVAFYFANRDRRSSR